MLNRRINSAQINGFPIDGARPAPDVIVLVRPITNKGWELHQPPGYDMLVEEPGYAIAMGAPPVYGLGAQ